MKHITRKRTPKSPALRHLRARYIGKNPVRLASLTQEHLNAGIAQAIYDLRTAAGLSQGELAKRVKTHPSAISRLEDADYGGHSLTMLRKIATALGQQIELRFVPAGSERKPVGSR